MPAASMARPQRSRSLSYCADQGGQLELGDRRSRPAGAAWRRRRPTSRGASGPNTHSAPITRPLVAGQRGARGRRRPARRRPAGGRGRARRSGRPVTTSGAAAGGGHRAERLLQRARRRRPTPGGRPRARGDDLDVGEQRDLAGRRCRAAGPRARRAGRGRSSRPSAGSSRRASSSRSGSRAQLQRPSGRREGVRRRPSGLRCRPPKPFCPAAAGDAAARDRAVRASPSPQLCHGTSVARNQPDARHSVVVGRGSGSRDDEGERGAAVMFHVQPRPPQQAPEPHDVGPARRSSWPAAGPAGPCAPC